MRNLIMLPNTTILFTETLEISRYILNEIELDLTN